MIPNQIKFWGPIALSVVAVVALVQGHPYLGTIIAFMAVLVMMYDGGNDEAD